MTSAGYREQRTCAGGLELYRRVRQRQAPGAPAPRTCAVLMGRLHAIPVLVAWGVLSDMFDVSTPRRMSREQPDLECMAVGNRGHAALLDEPYAPVAERPFPRARAVVI